LGVVSCFRPSELPGLTIWACKNFQNSSASSNPWRWGLGLWAGAGEKLKQQPVLRSAFELDWGSGIAGRSEAAFCEFLWAGPLSPPAMLAPPGASAWGLVVAFASALRGRRASGIGRCGHVRGHNGYPGGASGCTRGEFVLAFVADAGSAWG
jgi:hypothetical protein